MNADLIFQIYNSAILLPWGCMIFAPNSRITAWLTSTYIVPFIYGLSYSVLLIYFLIASGESMDFMSLDGVMRLFTTKEAVLLGWIHYLAFDLVAGMWAFSDAKLGNDKGRNIPHYLLAPCLGLTFIFGPLGFSLYWLLRRFYPKTV
jgi:hypothetical protein